MRQKIVIKELERMIADVTDRCAKERDEKWFHSQNAIRCTLIHALAAVRDIQPEQFMEFARTAKMDAQLMIDRAKQA